MKYKLIASSRSRATECYQGEDMSMVEVHYYKSGAVDAWPVNSIPTGLTIRYKDGDTWDTDPITELVTFPAIK